MTKIIGVKLKHRKDEAQELQKIATDFGCSIKTRIGLHDASDDECSPSGIILFEVINNGVEFEQALQAIEGATVKSMVF
ncbi:hypothetical protein tpqmel_0425 [Candidatus Gastranaerophilus sp. (ex Termes propinquus)]|nr:hypothetical protein tpqmel_0425 [Candidatus Gastranaerophilus sp. (ex Termes propinquus)]